MKKALKLEIDELAVESFETAAASGERGTVHGHATLKTCPGRDTCDAAAGTCYDSCVCGTAYPDYCPLPTYELAPSCMDTCDTCLETCRTCWTCTCYPPEC